ncbi:MAG: glycosyltransferase family 4 protein, partial [Clostridiales bacterium]|nr:glycosyltransferase family 4 protein [Clostridiales bacterium]
KLYNSEDLRKRMGENNRNLAEEKFDRKYTYPQIIELIKNLLN